MPRAKKTPKKPVTGGRAPHVLVRIPLDMVDRIDAVRDPLVPREPYIRNILEGFLDDVEASRKRAAARKRRR